MVRIIKQPNQWGYDEKGNYDADIYERDKYYHQSLVKQYNKHLEKKE